MPACCEGFFPSTVGQTFGLTKIQLEKVSLDVQRRQEVNRINYTFGLIM